MPQPARFRNAALIYNPMAGGWRGRRRRELERAIELLEAYGIPIALIPTTEPASATELARREVAAGRDLIIVCGGDGTVNEVVNGMAGSQVPLAILPAGTGNAVATALGLPWSVWRAAEYIPGGVVRRIALGRAGERYFVGLAGAGADGHLVKRVNQPHVRHGRFKFFRYVLEAYAQLYRYDFPWFEVRIEGQVIAATQLILGRLRYYALPVTPRADLFSDDFEVYLVTGRSRFRYFLHSLAVLTQTAELLPEVRYLRARAVQAEPRRERVFVQVDGETGGELPMEFVIVPDALSLLVPLKLVR